MTMIMILIAVTLLGAVLMGAMAYGEAQAAPTVDLKEKLKSLNVDAERASKEIALGFQEKEKAKKPKTDMRKVMSQWTGAAYLEKLEKDLTQSDIPMKPHEFIALRVGLVIGAFVITQAITWTYWYSLLAAFVAFFVHIPVMKIKQAMRINKFVLQLAEFLVLITNSLRAGQTFLQGVDIASKESPNPIGMEFRQLLKETNLGIPVEQAFDNMLIRVPSEDLKIVMSAFTIQRQVGGNLADIMDQVAAMIRQRIQIQNQIKVLTTQGKLSGAIVGLLPVGLGTIISLINYSYMSKLWTYSPVAHWGGPILLGIGIFMQLLGCFVIYKICDIEV
jgi:tight adherence protein B